MSTRADSRIREYQALPLFTGWSRAQLRQIAGAASRLTVAAGTLLVHQGERGRQFVIVLDGRAAVWRDGCLLGEIGAGGHFGETGLGGDVREPASIVAHTEMIVDVIAQRDVVAQRAFATFCADLALVRRQELLDAWVLAS